MPPAASCRPFQLYAETCDGNQCVTNGRGESIVPESVFPLICASGWRSILPGHHNAGNANHEHAESKAEMRYRLFREIEGGRGSGHCDRYGEAGGSGTEALEAFRGVFLFFPRPRSGSQNTLGLRETGARLWRVRLGHRTRCSCSQIAVGREGAAMAAV